MGKRGRAIRAFEAFKGERPSKLRRVRLPDADVTGWEMGPMVGAAYEARRDGKTERYFHEFKKSARPRLVASDDGRQLYIEGGRYKVTERGIEDMPNLFVVNPDYRPRRKGTASTKGKGSAMARRRRKRSAVSIFTSNPRRRRRSRARARPAARRSIFARNPVRRRRSRAASAPRRIYRRNPSRRASARRRYRRNPIGGASVGKLTSLLMPAVFIGLGGVASEIACAYLPLPMAWKTGPMKYLVKGAVGVGVGLIIAKGFKQKRLGYYFAAGAVVLMTHDIVKAWMNANAPAVRLAGMGYTNPGSVARFGQYSRALPLNRFGQYGPQLRSQFGGANTLANARQPGGEMNFAA